MSVRFVLKFYSHPYQLRDLRCRNFLAVFYSSGNAIISFYLQVLAKIKSGKLIFWHEVEY